MDEEKQQEFTKRPYKIMPGDEIVVHRDDVISNNISYTFYYVNIKKKMQSENAVWFKKELSFKTGTDIPDGTVVKLIDFFEDVRMDKHNRYYPVWKLFVLDYEVVMDADQYRAEQQEIESYQNVEDQFV